MLDKICKQCGVNFRVRDYRSISAKYCSRSCNGKFRKSQEYKSKREKISLSCAYCGCSFESINTSEGRNKRTCSVDCANKIRANQLRLPEVREKSQKSPKRKIGRSILKKTCPKCSKEFSYTSRERKVFCSKQCAITVSAKNRQIDLDQMQVQRMIDSNTPLNEMLNELSVSYDTLRRSMTKWGITIPKILKVRNDGYFGYTTSKNHRRIMEQFLGRKLLSCEAVHHIDGMKSNNSISNLYVTNSCKHHRTVHHSIEKCAFELFRMGMITFENGEYRVSNKAEALAA